MTALLPHLFGTFFGVLLLMVAAWRSGAFPKVPCALVIAFLVWDFLLPTWGLLERHLLLFVGWTWLGVALLRCRMPGGSAHTDAMALGGGSSRWPAFLAWTVAGVAAATGLTALAVGLEADGEISWKAALLPALWGVPGAMLAAARPRNPVGWLVLVVATIFSGSALAEVWASPPARVAAGDLARRPVRRAARPVHVLALCLPDGRLPSRGWRLPVAFLISAQVLLVLAWVFVRGPAAAPDSDWPDGFDTPSNPVGVLPADWADTLSAAEWLLQVPLLLVLVAVVVRLLRADPGERTRVMSLLLALGVFVVAVVAGRAVWAPVADILDVAAAAFLAVVLVSAVLRRRLEGVAVVVSHSFVYAVLVVLVAAGYAVVVGLLSTVGAELSPFGAGVVAAAAALAVLPLRARLQRLRRPRDAR